VRSSEVGSSQDDSGLGEHVCGCCVGWLVGLQKLSVSSKIE
jgi:hypothetical protein